MVGRFEMVMRKKGFLEGIQTCEPKVEAEKIAKKNFGIANVHAYGVQPL